MNRLTAHALGEADPQTGKPVELSATQVRSIEILLKKSLPDLTSTEVTNVEQRTLDDLSTDEIIGMIQEHRTDPGEEHDSGSEEAWLPMQPETKVC
jgi:hypothetical protein